MAIKYYGIPSSNCTALATLSTHYGYLFCVVDTEAEKPGTAPIGAGCFAKDTEKTYRKVTSGWEETGSAIALDALAAPTDITTWNASSTAHGLLPS